MLTGPAPASRKAHHKAGLTVADIEQLEINEAIAAVAQEDQRRPQLDAVRAAQPPAAPVLDLEAAHVGVCGQGVGNQGLRRAAVPARAA